MFNMDGLETRETRRLIRARALLLSRAFTLRSLGFQRSQRLHWRREARVTGAVAAGDLAAARLAAAPTKRVAATK